MSYYESMHGEYQASKKDMKRFRKSMNAASDARRAQVRSEIQEALDAGLVTDRFGDGSMWEVSYKDDPDRKYQNWGREHRQVIRAMNTNSPNGKQVSDKAIDAVIPKTDKTTTSWGEKDSRGNPAGTVTIYEETNTIAINIPSGNRAVILSRNDWWRTAAQDHMDTIDWPKGGGGYCEYEGEDNTGEWEPRSLSSRVGPREPFHGDQGWNEYRNTTGIPHPKSPDGIRLSRPRSTAGTRQPLQSKQVDDKRGFKTTRRVRPENM